MKKPRHMLAVVLGVVAALLPLSAVLFHMFVNGFIAPALPAVLLVPFFHQWRKNR